MNSFDDKLMFIQKSLDMGEYDVVVKEACTLFELSLKKIFNQAIISLPFADRNEVQDSEKKIGKGNKGVSDFTFGELVGLFRESNLLTKWAKHSGRELGLIKSIDYAPIVVLRNKITHEGCGCNRYEAELVFSYLRNLLATIGISELEDALSRSFSQKETAQEPSTDAECLKSFTYFPDRGVIVNQSDGSRNVSFKVETINKIFSSIYSEIVTVSDEITAKHILRRAGYDSGRSFGSIMNSKWDMEQSELSIEDKISRWCEFDSEVGWGRFVNDLQVNDDSGEIRGNLVIIENYQAYKRKKNDSFICDFVKGYSEGVIEELLGGIEVSIICDMDSCPQLSPLKKKCSCTVKVNE